MDKELLNLIVQAFASLAAVGAAITAIWLGALDRRNARKIAQEDREASMRQARLLVEWEAAKRLSILQARGGHTDQTISRDMGAEALALIALLGPDRVPMLWNRRVGKSDEEMRALAADESKDQWVRDAIEAERAMDAIAREVRALS